MKTKQRKSKTLEIGLRCIRRLDQYQQHFNDNIGHPGR